MSEKKQKPSKNRHNCGRGKLSTDEKKFLIPCYFHGNIIKLHTEIAITIGTPTDPAIIAMRKLIQNKFL
jgi:broad specificity polyphosphatase/5'/3'-nucleotidase SurE